MLGGRFALFPELNEEGNRLTNDQMMLDLWEDDCWRPRLNRQRRIKWLMNVIAQLPRQDVNLRPNPSLGRVSVEQALWNRRLSELGRSLVRHTAFRHFGPITSDAV